MWVGREIQVMKPAKKRWQKLSIEDRTVIAYAFRDAIHNPRSVGDYTFYMYKRRSTEEVVQVHQFRIGFANFVFIDTVTALIVYDFWLDDDLALAAE